MDQNTTRPLALCYGIRPSERVLLMKAFGNNDQLNEIGKLGKYENRERVVNREILSILANYNEVMRSPVDTSNA